MHVASIGTVKPSHSAEGLEPQFTFPIVIGALFRMEKSTDSPHGCSSQYSPSKTTTDLASKNEWVEAEGEN